MRTPRVRLVAGFAGLIQETTATVLTFNQDIPAGSLLVVRVFIQTSHIHSSYLLGHSISDSQGNAYTDGGAVNLDYWGAFHYSVTTTPLVGDADTLTITHPIHAFLHDVAFFPADGLLMLQVLAVMGISVSVPLTGSRANTPPGTSSPVLFDAGSHTPAQEGPLLILGRVQWGKTGAAPTADIGSDYLDPAAPDGFTGVTEDGVAGVDEIYLDVQNPNSPFTGGGTSRFEAAAGMGYKIVTGDGTPQKWRASLYIGNPFSDHGGWAADWFYLPIAGPIRRPTNLINLDDKLYRGTEQVDNSLLVERSDTNHPPYVDSVTPFTPPAGQVDDQPHLSEDRGSPRAGRLYLMFTRWNEARTEGNVYESFSADRGRTWNDPELLIPDASFPFRLVDRTTGTTYRAAWREGYLVATRKHAGGTESAPFYPLDAAGQAIALDEAPFSITASAGQLRRWILTATVSGVITDFRSTDEGLTWTQL